ncbi:MAG TPA: hypothetical protein VI299_18480 [Polyangiales bacterium]
MKLPGSPEFTEQRALHVLRFTCEHCTYFASETERCTHGYPNQLHRLRRYEDPTAELVFCKDFELR